MNAAAVTGPARWKMAAVTLAAGLLAVGCGSGGLYGGGGSSGSTSAAASSPAPSPTSALCQDAAALRASLNKLTHVSVAPGAGDEIKTDLADVKEKLNALRAQSHGELQAQTNALKTALLKLQGAASTLSSNPSASAVSDVVAALREVTSSGSTLLAALSKKCPSASALSGM
jgi:ribosomal protein L29